MALPVAVLIFALISFVVQGYAPESPAETYWKTKLGDDTTMPKVVKDGLITDYDAKAYATHSINAGQLNYDAKAYLTHSVNAAKVYTTPKAYFTHSIDAAKVYTAPKMQFTHSVNAATKVYNAPKAKFTHSINAAKVYTAPKMQFTHSVNAATKVYTAPKAQFTHSINAAKVYTAHSIKDGPKNNKAKPQSTVESLILADHSTLFFFEKDLIHPGGTSMMLHFLVDNEKAKFLPVQVAESIPFSSSKLPEILKKFSVKPGSYYAKIMDDNIKLCEAKPVKGEVKSCTNSLEAMVDFAMSNMGNKVEVRSTEINQETKTKYVVEGAKKINNDVDNLVCHKLIYPCALFYCHKIQKTDAYDVSLVDQKGNKAKAIAVCHKDTSSWDPEHLVFELLKVKPGSVPICHFLNENTIIWIPK